MPLFEWANIKVHSLSRMAKITLVGLCTTFVLTAEGHAQTEEELQIARDFFAAHDVDGNGLLSQSEFVQGFINQSLADNPTQTRLAMLLYGRGRIENCLGLGYEKADLSADGLLAIEELGEAYRQKSFDDLRDIC